VVMRPPAPRVVALLLSVLLLVAAACSDDDEGSGDPATSTTTESSVPPDDPELEPLLITADDLPGAYGAVEDVGDTVTTFCAGEDATAGLQASGRAIVGFNRTMPGASVIHLVFRFREGDGPRFVQQAGEVLDRCSAVPDLTGLAFRYEPVAAPVEAALVGTDQHVTRFGISVGSEAFTEQIAVFRHGEVAQLIAVLGADLPRADLDALATAAFAAAAARAAG
jgi:hypothetical protein